MTKEEVVGSWSAWNQDHSYRKKENHRRCNQEAEGGKWKENLHRLQYEPVQE